MKRSLRRLDKASVGRVVEEQKPRTFRQPQKSESFSQADQLHLKADLQFG